MTSQLKTILSPPPFFIVPPKFDLRPSIHLDTYKLPAGAPLKVDFPYKGLPSPRATWYKDDRPLIDSPRTRLHYTPQSIGLHIPDSIRDDTGFYRVHLASDIGEDKTQFRVSVMGKSVQIQ